MFAAWALPKTCWQYIDIFPSHAVLFRAWYIANWKLSGPCVSMKVNFQKINMQFLIRFVGTLWMKLYSQGFVRSKMIITVWWDESDNFVCRILLHVCKCGSGEVSICPIPALVICLGGLPLCIWLAFHEPCPPFCHIPNESLPRVLILEPVSWSSTLWGETELDSVWAGWIQSSVSVLGFTYKVSYHLLQ